jgi:hypothetical protein
MTGIAREPGNNIDTPQRQALNSDYLFKVFGKLVKDQCGPATVRVLLNLEPLFFTEREGQG